MPTALTQIMPENTGVPSDRRVICAAPVAITSGNNPATKAI